ncbi:MAG: hypothetical protein MUO54_03360, partial [Anaerolineales bacterium]|nr:hypothetical protein [Anaerolineales bacterium]
FLASSALVVIGQGISGMWTRAVLFYFLVSIPVVLLAVGVGDKIVQKIPEEKYNRIINIFLVIAGGLMFIN